MSYMVSHDRIETFIANEALEANRIVIINASTDTKVEYPAANADGGLLGITITAADSGAQVDVCTAGVALLKVDATTDIAVGDWIINSDAVGQGEKIGSTAGTRYPVIGQARKAATADGEIIPVEIIKTEITTPAS